LFRYKIFILSEDDKKKKKKKIQSTAQFELNGTGLRTKNTSLSTFCIFIAM